MTRANVPRAVLDDAAEGRRPPGGARVSVAATALLLVTVPPPPTQVGQPADRLVGAVQVEGCAAGDLHTESSPVGRRRLMGAVQIYGIDLGRREHAAVKLEVVTAEPCQCRCSRGGPPTHKPPIAAGTDHRRLPLHEPDPQGPRTPST